MTVIIVPPMTGPEHGTTLETMGGCKYKNCKCALSITLSTTCSRNWTASAREGGLTHKSAVDVAWMAGTGNAPNKQFIPEDSKFKPVTVTVEPPAALPYSGLTAKTSMWPKIWKILKFDGVASL